MARGRFLWRGGPGNPKGLRGGNTRLFLKAVLWGLRKLATAHPRPAHGSALCHHPSLQDKHGGRRINRDHIKLGESHGPRQDGEPCIPDTTSYAPASGGVARAALAMTQERRAGVSSYSPSTRRRVRSPASNLPTTQAPQSPSGSMSPFLPPPLSGTHRLQQPCPALQPPITQICLEGIALLRLKSTAKFSLTSVLLDYVLKENCPNEVKPNQTKEDTSQSKWI